MVTEMTFMQPAEARRSIAALDHALPTEWYDFLNLSSAFFVLGDTSLALTNARAAVRMQRTPETLLNLAVILESQGEFYSAFPLASAAYRLDPSSRTAACLYSDALLRLGWFREAWPIYADSHANWDWMSGYVPRWDGCASLKRKRILVLSCGGYGDNILFSRWLLRLADLGASVTFLCPESLHSLFRHHTYISHLLVGSINGYEGTLEPSDYDYHIPLFALPEFFCPSPEDIPTAPYLSARPHDAALRRDVLRHGDWPHYGICDRAGEENFPRRHRSLNDDQTQRILKAGRDHGVEWVNLSQHAVPNILQPTFRTWADTAAVISLLDLVVTVDTGVAHLAGAMGKPTWVILPGISTAYYGVHGDRCVWYPSQRLFRNDGEGIDHSVSAVCAALERT